MLWHHLQRLIIGLWLLLILAFSYAIKITWITPTSSKPLVCGVVDFSDSRTVRNDHTLIEGKRLFRNNCASCHANDMKSNLTGPALGGVRERWASYGGDTVLHAFIRNSQGIITSGQNKRANQLWAEWEPTVMNDFSALTNEEIDAILSYVEMVYKSERRY